VAHTGTIEGKDAERTGRAPLIQSLFPGRGPTAHIRMASPASRYSIVGEQVRREFSMKAFSAGLTNIGRKRDNNEDTFHVDDNIGLYIVADGMGGHRAGEVASRTVVSSIRDYMDAFSTSEEAQHIGTGEVSPAYAAVCHSIELANRVVHQLSQNQGSYRGMGSTAAVAFLHGDTLVTANVGDSRIYLVRQGKIEQLTKDHTLLAEQMRKNPGLDSHFSTSPMKHILMRAVGIQETVQTDAYEMQPRSGDMVLMCSDGLTDMLSDHDVLQAILQRGTLDETCRRLVDLANERGGNDNITVVLIQFEKEEKGLFQKLFRSG
jgi:serine/threonine protein phosphatase PrpC